FPSSGEINRRVSDPEQVMAYVLSHYQVDAVEIDHTDGLSMNMGTWRFNLRKSNTEPLIRLNVETKQDRTLLSLKVDELLSFLI
ncbi:MAG TPA: phosphomannomutase CpsG, partial [Vibrio sp.]|nr:phosphomannomutase CpsG [Vibrio sp.]